VINDDAENVLLEFVQQNFVTERTAAIDRDTPLLTAQIVDSMGITLLAAFIEERFGVACDGTEIRRGRLETVRGLAAWIADRS
jgi:acyl carrier protein